MQTVTSEYLMGIKEGRETMNKFGVIEVSVSDRVENIRSTLKEFSSSSPVGQMLLGELDFWKNQLKTK